MKKMNNDKMKEVGVGEIPTLLPPCWQMFYLKLQYVNKKM